MADPLSPADRASLAAERGPVNMAVGGLLVLDAGPGLERRAVVERLASRLHLIPRYRQRLEEVPLGLGAPAWADDEGFDLDWHVRHTSVPTGGGRDALADLTALEMSRRLDLRRPLWELTVIDLPDEERVALLARMHHALVDGVAAVDAATVLLDPTPEPQEIPAPEEPWRAKPYDPRRHLARLARTPVVSTQRLLMDAAARALGSDPRRAAEDLRRATDLLRQLAQTRPQAPMTPLNQPLGPNRRCALHRAPLDRIKAAARGQGATVNDALLAAVSGTLREYLQEAGALPSAPPVALVPVSVGRPGDEGGNRISTVLVDLPVHEPDARARLAAVSAAMRELKRSAAVRAGALLVAAGGWAPPLVSSVLARAFGGVRAFNLVASNIPGPQQPFYLNGCRAREAYPLVPLNPTNQRLSVGILSFDGAVGFSLLADRELDPPVGVAARALQSAVDELLAMTS